MKQGQYKQTKDVHLPCGSIIHYSRPRQWRKGNSYVLVTCGECEKSRWSCATTVKAMFKPNHTGLCSTCGHSCLAGSIHPSWQGGKTFSEGYVYIHRENLSLKEQQLLATMITKAGYILEHRLVVARSLNRPLKQSEVVHHLNGDRQDNRLANLSLLDSSKHVKTHYCKLDTYRKEIARLQSILDANDISY